MTCTVEILTCDTNRERLAALKDRAEAQRTGNLTEFKSPYPWAFDFCKDLPTGIHFVASTDDTICGWALLEEEGFAGVKTMEIGSITTRRKPMGTQRIGRLLHDTIVTYATDHGKDLIILHAADADVAKIYGKWGYLPVFSEAELATIEATPKILEKGKKEEFSTELRLMMYYKLKSDIPEKLKEMIIKDAESMALLGWYGGPYRNAYKGGGRKTRRRKLQKRGSRRVQKKASVKN
jgi:hypothetical protein